MVKMVILKLKASNWMDNFFGNKEVGNVEERGYRLRVAIAGYRVTPRDEVFEYLRDTGMPHLENILHQKPLGTDYLTLVFPERWLSVHEQHMLIPCLDAHPDIRSKKVTSVDILTQNALITGNCRKGELIKFDTPSGFRGKTESELQALINASNAKTK